MTVARLDEPRDLRGTLTRAARIFRLASIRLYIVKSSSETPDNAAHPLLSTKDADCESFILRHQREILNYLWRMTGERESACDLTQEVFLRAWQRFDTIRHYDQPRQWLFRVATNLAISYLRRRALSVGRAAPLDDGEDYPSASDPAWRVAERDLVRETLMQMPPKRRAALVLREVYGMTPLEVGTVLGMSQTAVRMALYRGREQFRALYLEKDGDGDGV